MHADDIQGSTTLGFMNSVHPLHQSITKTASPSYNFLHLMLQEFLAAIHIWKTYSQQEQLLFIEKKSGRHNMIILFLAGLTTFRIPGQNVFCPSHRLDQKTMRWWFTSVENTSCRDTILWLYESQNTQLISSFDNVVLSIELISSRYDPLYFFALGYCIAVGNFLVDFEISDPIPTMLC